MITWPLVYKLLAPLVSAITIICLVLIERKDKSLLYCWVAILFAVTLLIATSIIIYKDHEDSTELTEMMQKSLSLQGDDTVYKIFVESQREIINRISSKDSDDFMDDLSNNIDKKREHRQNLDIASQRLAMKYKIMLEPFKIFILSEIDNRMERLILKGHVSEIKKIDYDAVVIDSDPGLREPRRYFLNKGYSLIVEMRALRIDAGQLRHGFHLALRIRQQGSFDDRIFEINSSDKQTRLFPCGPDSGISEFYTDKSPMDDKEFVDNLVDAINKSVQYIVIESSVFKDK